MRDGGWELSTGDEFLGRVTELARLHVEAARANEGSARLVVVRDPAGIGKTSLLREFWRQIDDVDGAWQTLRAVGADVDGTDGYSLLSQLDRRFARLLDRSEPFPSPSKTGAELVQMLGDAQSNGPVCLVIDDAHWADLPFVQALLFALRHLQHDRVLTVVAERSDDEGRLPDGIDRLAALSGASIDLTGLTVEDLARLASATGRPISFPRLRRLAEHTGGNPLYFRELLAVLDDRSVGQIEAGLPAPQHVNDLVVTRLAKLPSAARALVGAVSVIGGEPPLSTVAAVAGVSVVLEPLDEALASGLLELRLDELTLRVATDDDTLRLAAMLPEILTPATYHHMPRLIEGSLRDDPVETAENYLRYTWRCRSNLSPARWELPMTVLHAGRVVGVQSMHAEEFATTPTVRTGSFLHPDMRGNGVGRTMRAMVIEFAFTHLGAAAVGSGYAEGNAASAAVSARLGYQPTGTRTDTFRGEDHVTHLVELPCERWPAFRPAQLDRMVVRGADTARACLGIDLPAR